MSTLRRNAVANLAGRVATAVLWLVATPFVLARLGPERFGIWSLFFAFNAYLASFDLGVGHTMLRFIAAQRPARDRQALLRTLRFGFVIAITLGLVWTVAIEWSRHWIAQVFHVPPAMMGEALSAMSIFGIGVLVLFTVQATMASLAGFERIDLSNLCQTVGIVVHIAGMVVLLSAGAGLRGAAIAGIVGQIAAGALALVMLLRELAKVPSTGQAPPLAWRDMAHFSAALQLLGVLIMLQTQAGKLMVGILGNLVMVADYELAFRVAFAVGSLPTLMRDPVIPVVSRTYLGEGSQAVTGLFQSTSRWVYAYSVLVMGAMWLLAPDLARVWLGPGHEHIAELMRLWVLAYALNLAYAPGVAIARGMGMPRFEVVSYAAALATTIGLCLWWVPLRGTAGAVEAILVSYAVGLVVFVWPFHREAGVVSLGTWLRRDLAPRAVAGIVAVAAAWWLLEASPLAAHLPPPGLVHGVVTGTTFVIFFSLCFLPLGDTQRLSSLVAQFAAGAMPRFRSSS